MVSSASITGENKELGEQTEYFERVRSMNLNHPALIGFGISDHEKFEIACSHARGAIIGSAFINSLESSGDPVKATFTFIKSIKES